MELLVLDTNFESVCIIDSFNSMIWVDRYSGYGDFELEMSVNVDNLERLKEDNYLWLRESDHVMIIESIEIDTNVEDGNRLIVKGRSLESILYRRIIWGQKTITGNLQNGIKTLLNEAFISPTDPDRKIDNLTFEESTDPAITKLTIDKQYTGEYIYDAIKTICDENNIGFKIVLNDSNQFVFSLYSGVDRSYDQLANSYVIFSPKFENIINSNYYHDKSNFKNVTFVAGEGEGASRKTTSVGSSSGMDRREVFTDARDISSDTEEGTLTEKEYIAKLASRGSETLSEHIVNTAFEGKVEATNLFKYGEDFHIGDIVQIANEHGHEGRAYISEFIMSQNAEEISMYPTFQTI